MHTHLPVTKQYNSVLAQRRRCSTTGIVTRGLSERLSVNLGRADCLLPASLPVAYAQTTSLLPLPFTITAMQLDFYLLCFLQFCSCIDSTHRQRLFSTFRTLR